MEKLILAWKIYIYIQIRAFFRSQNQQTIKILNKLYIGSLIQLKFHIHYLSSLFMSTLGIKLDVKANLFTLLIQFRIEIEMLGKVRFLKHRPENFACYFIVFALIISILFSFHQYFTVQSFWGVRIDHKIMKQQGSKLLINLEHQFGDQIPKDLAFRINDEKGKSRIQNIRQMNSTFLSHELSTKGSKAKHVYLESKSDIKVRANGRLLQAVDQSPPSFAFISTFIKYFFSVCRNMIIISTLTGTFDIWMPLLMFIETFLCLSLWTHNAHYFTSLYKQMYLSKFDIFNMIRIFIAGDLDISNNSHLASFGLTNKFAINCAGQLTFFIFLIVLTILVKVFSLFVKSERLRLLNSKLRPRWNGYLFWISPKILSMAGFCLRLAPQSPDGMTIVHLIIAALSVLICIVFFATLIIQVRKISGKLQYIEQSRLQIGLAGRIDYMRDFQFDCLQYSMLYYPSMNYLKYLVAGCCIGFAYDFHYVQFGGVIAAQVIFMMIQISSSGYKLKRNKIVYPIMDFIYVIFFLVFIGIGLIFEVGHLPLTLKLQTIGFSIIFGMSIVLILQTFLDFVEFCRSQESPIAKDTNIDKQQFDNGSNNGYNSSKTEDFGLGKATEKDYIKPEEQHSSNESNNEVITKNKEGFGQKIKKVKNGKLF